MRAPAFLVALLLFVLLPTGSAQSEIDATIQLSRTAEPNCDCPTGWFTLMEWDSAGTANWTIDLPLDYTIVDVRMPTGIFGVQRPDQVVPLLHVPTTDYPLFNYYPDAKVWETESHVRLFHYIVDESTTTLRLGIPGPTAGTLLVHKDVTPPTFELGPVEDITHLGFHQETTTNEHAIGDLQWRRAGTDDPWVVNPTPTYHLKQIFPIQGMDPDTAYTVRAVFTDWAGNNVTSDPYTVRTLPKPEGEPVTVTPLSPKPDSVVTDDPPFIAAELDAPDATIDHNTVRLFVDLEEVPGGFGFDGARLTWVPREPLGNGEHVISVEAESMLDGYGHARWTFRIGTDADTTTTPGPGALALGLVLVGLALTLRRR